MAFWCRINRFKLKHCSHQIQRYYLGIANGAYLNSNASHTGPCVVENPYWVIHSGPNSFCNNVRFFAAPVQAKPKEEKDTSGPRMNDKITAPIVRLVTEEGHFQVSRNEALERARKLQLDLVEVQRNANPPVCKIMDFHREKYKQQLKEKDRAKSQSKVTLRKGECKEVRFSGKIEVRDLKMKADQAIKFMEQGYRVKCRVLAMGKECQDLGSLLDHLSSMIEDVAIVESGPEVKEKEAYMLVRHVKFATSKKGGGKKLKAVGKQSAKVQTATTAPAAVDSDGPLEVNKNAWSVAASDDDFEEVFQFGDDVNGVTSGSTDKQLETAQETTSSSSNVNGSDFLRPSPLPDFTRTNQVPSSSQGPSIGTENSYNRTEPRNKFSPTKPSDNRGPGMRDSSRLEPQFPNQRRQYPVEKNISPSAPEGRQVGTDTSVSRNLNLKVPPINIPKREPSPPGAPSTPSSSYGIFSTSNASGRGVAAEVPRQSERNPHDSPRNSGATGDSQGPGLDKVGTKSFGIFSQTKEPR